MRIGVDYYPEHWDRSLWKWDADRMKEAGVQVVRMAEFAWSRLEPVEGAFDFTWLDEVISLFAERQIQVVLCTPTATPPLWLFENYPETIQVGKDGRRIQIGIRGHRCMTSPVFRTYAARIITEMVSHYRDNATVIGYQIDNELEANHCRCEVCSQGFRAWVKRRYGIAEEVNEAYGNNVWSGEYSDFSQVKPPMGDYIMWQNPSLTLDYNRYASDSTIAYVEFQRELIHKLDEKAMITTNNWLCENMPDFYQLFEKLDLVSYDNYPTTRLPEDPEELYSHDFHLDLMRGIKRKNFWIMEQLSGPVGSWMPMSRTLQPGMLSGYSLQAFAHGADTVVHFRWRTAVSGAEMYWHGILDHSNNLNGRRYQEFCQLCQKAQELEPLQGSVIRNRVALLYGSDQEYGFKLQHQAEGMYYMEQLKLLHDGFARIGIGVDVINETESLKGYDIVLAPTLLIRKREVIQELYRFVGAGGILLMTNRSGVKDENNKCIMDSLPTQYQDLLGISVSEYDVLGTDTCCLQVVDVACQQALGKNATVMATQWCDLVEPEMAQTLMTYGENFYWGVAAVTENDYEQGHAYYVGTVLERAGYQALAKKMAAEAGIGYIDNLPAGLEYTVREMGQKSWGFLFNNSQKRVEFTPQFCGEVMGGLMAGKSVKLKPFEMKIVSREG